MPELEAPVTPSADEINAAKAESIFENNVAAETSHSDAPEPTKEPETVPMASGITRVRGLRAGSLAALIAIIGPHAKQLLELIAGFDPAHLQHLLVRLTQYGEIKEAEHDPAYAGEQRVMIAAGIFEAWSRMTPGTRDDDYSNWLNRILADNALRDEFVKIVGYRIANKDDGSHDPEKVKAGGELLAKAAREAGIEAPDVLHFAETIAGVIETLK